MSIGFGESGPGSIGVLSDDDALDFLLRGTPGPDHSWRWATVTAIEPLAVVLDGDTAALDTEPVTLTPSLVVGRRVLVLLLGGTAKARQPIIVGTGASGASPTTGYVRRNVASDVAPGSNDVIYIGGAEQTGEPSLRLARLRDGKVHEGYIYVPANIGGSPEIALLTRLDGVSMSRMRLTSTGAVVVNTYGDGVTRPLPFAHAVGTVAIPAINNGSQTEVAVTFPSGRFTSIPVMTVSATFTSGGSARLTLAPKGITTSGFIMQANNWSGTNAGAQSVGWIAMQESP